MELFVTAENESALVDNQISSVGRGLLHVEGPNASWAGKRLCCPLWEVSSLSRALAGPQALPEAFR